MFWNGNPLEGMNERVEYAFEQALDLMMREGNAGHDTALVFGSIWTAGDQGIEQRLIAETIFGEPVDADGMMGSNLIRAVKIAFTRRLQQRFVRIYQGGEDVWSAARGQAGLRIHRWGTDPDIREGVSRALQLYWIGIADEEE